MAFECVATCPRMNQAFEEAVHGLTIGILDKGLAVAPGGQVAGLVGTPRLVQGMQKITGKIMPTIGEQSIALNPNAANDILAIYELSRSCAGPGTAPRDMLLPFSRTRAAFGYETTSKMMSPVCTAVGPGDTIPAPRTLHACPEMQRHAAIVSERLAKVAEMEGLIPAIRKGVMRHLDKKAMEYAKEAIKEAERNKELLTGEARRLAERAATAGQVIRYAGRLARVFNLVKNSADAVLFFQAGKSLDALKALTAGSVACTGVRPDGCPIANLPKQS